MWNSCGNPSRRFSGAKLGNKLVLPAELAKVPRARLASVLVDHRVAVVAGPVGNPRLRLTRRKRDRHERRAQVVRSESLTGLAALEELRSRHADASQIVANLIGQALDVDRYAVLGKHVVSELRVWLIGRLPAS